MVHVQSSFHVILIRYRKRNSKSGIFCLCLWLHSQDIKRKNNKEKITRTACPNSLARHVSYLKKLNEELYGREFLKGVS